MITAQIAKQYHFLMPPVYRYMNKKYIDEFFDTGRIRLSSFNIYKKYEDSVRGDKGEGMNIAIATSIKDNMTVYAVLGVGMDAYSLCSSTIYSQELLSKFESDGAFRIKDSQSFGLTIANKVKDLVEGMQGHCIYVDARTTKKEIESLSLDKMKISPEGQELDMGKMAQKMREINSVESFFMKPMEYQYQSEYRFIWLVQGKTEEYIEIECKEAIQFCERID